ncbi:MAG: hypothetical protein ABI164_00055, partial [Acidobacteriaceae bacterium]
DFEFRRDEYHRHWATSIGETFEFHMRAFANPALDTTPQLWNYASADNSFNVWGYHLSADIAGPAIIYMDHVTRGGMLLRTRRWAPDGPPAACTRIDLTTAPLYQHAGKYQLLDYNVSTGTSSRRELTADSQGRLHLQSDCNPHELAFSGPQISASPLVLLPVTQKDFLRVMPGHPLELPIRLWNPDSTPRRNIAIEITSAYPTVKVLHDTAAVKELAAGQAIDLSPEFRVEFTAGDGEFARARLNLKVTAADAPPTETYIDVLIAPANLSAPKELVVLDGRTQTFPIFWQGVHGGGASVPRTVTEGKGNGSGVLEPGEQATVWLRLPQGLDPFDKENWCRAKVYSNSPWLSETADIQENKRHEWTGAQNRTSEIELSPATPAGTPIKAILDCEAYSFTYTPDVRYGKLPLYQPFQLHKHYLFLWSWKVNAAASSARR